ncbi:hypothetical protein IWQ60_001685 [Tieghemiomyces parasiticus]|uniref:AAA+ ATPase domain-containing protein n=1 Tax=Tieghemiomyces parasiticus TaxID=78921 RepID=A0A9W8E1N9_9FUNG|nr:hypothetical protein IWQ60_001685 [Tieghemiomyces parasiticus]
MATVSPTHYSASSRSQSRPPAPDSRCVVDRVGRTVGGYAAVVTALVRTILAFQRAHERSAHPQGPPAVTPPTVHSALLTGAPGAGKTHLARTLAVALGLPYRYVDATTVFHTNEGESERYLTELFTPPSPTPATGARPGPFLVIVDHLDVLGGRSLRSELCRRVYSRLLGIWDAPPVATRPLFLIGITARPELLQPELLRPDRFGGALYPLALRTPIERLAVLRILGRSLPFDHEELDKCQQEEEARGQSSSPGIKILARVAELTHGFTPADLQNLCVTVIQAYLQRTVVVRRQSVPDVATAGGVEPLSASLGELTLAEATSSSCNRSTLLLEDFTRALAVVQPAGLAEFRTRLPAVAFSDVYGLDDVVAQLTHSVVRPFRHRAVYRQLGLRPPAGVLLHGPSGVGKTMLCCALATATGVNCILAEATQLRSKYVGETERGLAQLFARARAMAPCLLIVEQLDVLAPVRGSARTTENTNERIVASFLTEIDGFHGRANDSSDGDGGDVPVIVVATSNRPSQIDPALLRPGRLDQHINIPLPDPVQRTAILARLAERMPVVLTPAFQSRLVAATEGASGADLKNVLQEAALISLRQDIHHTTITEEHVREALRARYPDF